MIKQNIIEQNIIEQNAVDENVIKQNMIQNNLMEHTVIQQNEMVCCAVDHTAITEKRGGKEKMNGEILITINPFPLLYCVPVWSHMIVIHRPWYSSLSRQKKVQDPSGIRGFRTRESSFIMGFTPDV